MRFGVVNIASINTQHLLMTPDGQSSSPEKINMDFSQPSTDRKAFIAEALSNKIVHLEVCRTHFLISGRPLTSIEPSNQH